MLGGGAVAGNVHLLGDGGPAFAEDRGVVPGGSTCGGTRLAGAVPVAVGPEDVLGVACGELVTPDAVGFVGVDVCPGVLGAHQVLALCDGLHVVGVHAPTVGAVSAEVTVVGVGVAEVVKDEVFVDGPADLDVAVAVAPHGTGGVVRVGDHRVALSVEASCPVPASVVEDVEAGGDVGRVDLLGGQHFSVLPFVRGRVRCEVQSEPG